MVMSRGHTGTPAVTAASMDGESLARALHRRGMRREEHVEDCLHQQRRVECEGVSVRHRPLNRYDIEVMLDECEVSAEGLRLSAHRRENAMIRWRYRYIAERLARDALARSTTTWRAWDAGNRLERLVSTMLLGLHVQSMAARREFVQDTAQDVRERVTEKLHLYDRRKAAFGPWVRVLTKRVLLRNVQRERSRASLLSDSDERERLPREPVFPTVDQMIELDAIRSLPQARLLFMRNLIEDESESTLTDAEKKMEQRARRRLREQT